MMAELTPPGFDNMVGYLSLHCSTKKPHPKHSLAHICCAAQFFGLFGLSNRASSMIGPNVIQAIIDHTGDNWQGFPFLFALCAAASIVIWFGVDIERGRRAAVRWAQEQREAGARGGVDGRTAE